MGKIIYMDQTIKLISLINPMYTQEIIKDGLVKETSEKIPYLLINK